MKQNVYDSTISTSTTAESLDAFANCVWYKYQQPMRYETSLVLGKFCVPSDKELAGKAMEHAKTMFS